MFYFYTPRKCQKTKGFLVFSGGIEMERWAKMEIANLVTFTEEILNGKLHFFVCVI